jgi:hypothetical protein
MAKLRVGRLQGSSNEAERAMTDQPGSPPMQQQEPPGRTAKMTPKPDHGERTYRGSGKLAGKKALITGADSGIGRAVAIAFAREGADVLISYYNEHEDARETASWVEEAGRRAILAAGDVKDEAYCSSLVERAVSEFGGLDILINNAAHQRSFEAIEDISPEEWDVKHLQHVLHVSGSGAAHEAGRLHHQHLLHQCNFTLPASSRIRDDEGSRCKLHGGLRTAARGKGHSG